MINLDEKATEFLKMMAPAMADAGEITPMFCLFNEKGKPHFVPCHQRPITYKEYLTNFAKEKEIVLALFVAEAWIKKKMPPDYKYGDIEKSDDKEERIIVTAETKAQQICKTFHIVRDKDGKPSVGDEDASNAEFSMSFMGFLYDENHSKTLN